MIASTPTSASEPGMGPSSILIISPSDLPSRRTDTKRTMKSCTAPAVTTPARIHSVPGRNPICAASTGPTSGPAPAIAAKWWPYSTHLLVGT